FRSRTAPPSPAPRSRLPAAAGPQPRGRLSHGSHGGIPSSARELHPIAHLAPAATLRTVPCAPQPAHPGRSEGQLAPCRTFRCRCRPIDLRRERDNREDRQSNQGESKMNVRDAMVSDVKSCPREANLEEVARMMWDNDVGAIPIVSEDNRPLGIVTDRDIAMCAMHNHRPLWEIQASEVIQSQRLCCCDENDSIQSCLEKM